MKFPFPLRSCFLLTCFAASLQAAPIRVSFVFDDGPVPAQTRAMLKVLAEAKVKVNFSYVGRNVDANPELAVEAAKAGHEIQNHSYTHPHLNTLDEAAVLAEVTKASAAIEKATGRRPAFFWAPFLEMNDQVEAQVKAAGLRHFPYKDFNFISTDDWNVKETDGAKIRRLATTHIVDGTVILCHEWPEATLKELPGILEELKRQGCVFLTFSELAATRR